MEVSELVRGLLHKRGVTEDHAIAEFLDPDYELHTHSPLLLCGMDKAVGRLLRAVADGERVAIYADFDSDGIPGAALLHDFFRKIGFDNFEVYIPHRDREGHGFHKGAVDALHARGVSLIVTIDVGTTAAESVAHASGMGVDTIITDHHEIVGAIPDCIAVVNPKLPPWADSPYPFPHLCGAAVAWKLVQATLAAGRAAGLARFEAVPEGWEKWLLDLVAIATVADLVPLVGENRVLAQFGLRVLRKTPRLGIHALCNSARMRRSELTEEDIAFSIAPRLNAASRMDEPLLAFTLLTTGDAGEAERIAAVLEDLNQKRKGVVSAIVRKARKAVAARYGAEARAIVAGDADWKPSLLGLAANSIMQERGGMVCLWGRDAEGRLKGSCRSDGSVSVAGLLAAVRGSLVEFGGHERSGGFTVSHEEVHLLPEALARAASEHSHAAAAEHFSADAILSLSEVSRPLFEDVSRLAPFGMGNPKPVFLLSGVVTDMKRFGKDKNHVELLLECRRTGVRVRAFQFFMAPEEFTFTPARGIEVGVAASIERDTFRGGFALRLVDVREGAEMHSAAAREGAGVIG